MGNVLLGRTQTVWPRGVDCSFPLDGGVSRCCGSPPIELATADYADEVLNFLRGLVIPFYMPVIVWIESRPPPVIQFYTIRPP